jgi:hypothetical protein
MMLGWESAMSDLSRDWTRVVAHERERVASWDAVITEMAAEVAQLKRKGSWVSGPSDLLSVIGLARHELIHSRIVGWLLTPTGHHGLGSRVLSAILDAGWPAPEYTQPELNDADVQWEVPCGVRRADVVIHMGETKLVIENKVDHTESDAQCEDLYEWWRNTTPDVRFLLLSPLGRPPLSTTTPEAAEAWRSMSYGAFRTVIQESLQSASGSAAGVEAVRQYLRALAPLSPPHTSFVITPGGGHVQRQR